MRGQAFAACECWRDWMRNTRNKEKVVYMACCYNEWIKKQCTCCSLQVKFVRSILVLHAIETDYKILIYFETPTTQKDMLSYCPIWETFNSGSYIPALIRTVQSIHSCAALVNELTCFIGPPVVFIFSFWCYLAFSLKKFIYYSYLAWRIPWWKFNKEGILIMTSLPFIFLNKRLAIHNHNFESQSSCTWYSHSKVNN